MVKSISFKWCALVVGCAALFLYSRSQTAQTDSPFAQSKTLVDEQDAEAAISVAPQQDVSSVNPQANQLPQAVDQLAMEISSAVEQAAEMAPQLETPERVSSVMEMMESELAMEIKDVAVKSGHRVVSPFAESAIETPISTMDNNRIPNPEDLFEFESDDSLTKNLADQHSNSKTTPTSSFETTATTPVAQAVNLPNGVLAKAVQHIEYGKSLARRGAVFGAKNEFHNALRLIAQAVDYHLQSDQYTNSLYRAMVALKEADDFYLAQNENGGKVDLASIAKHHESKILTAEQIKKLKPVEALQEYYSLIQKNFAAAGGKSIVASEALFCLGKLYLIKGKDIVEGDPLDNAKAIVHHRAAIDCNQSNYKSANELAVLLARTGRLRQAKNLLVHSLKVQQVPQAWENLARIHGQLGEQQLSQRAFSEFQRMMNAPPSTQQIKWVSPEQFASSSSEPAELRTALNTQQPQPQTKPAKEGALKSMLKKVF